MRALGGALGPFVMGDAPQGDENLWPECWPDLDDPATHGCLESMIDRFHGVACNPDGTWRVMVYGHRITREQPFWSEGATKGEALAKALLKQWGLL